MKYVFVVLLFSICLMANAQSVPSVWTPNPPNTYPFIHYEANTVDNEKGLDSVYRKLLNLKNTRKGRVTVVHIGDSHIQADGITGVVRNNFQAYFGDAGRGLVFPYQLAHTNAPLDIKANSNVTWKNNRITTPDKPLIAGVSGYGIHATDRKARVSVHLNALEGKQSTFNQMQFFLCDDRVCYQITDSALVKPVLFWTEQKHSKAGVTVQTDSLLTGFELCMIDAPEQCDYSFYGVSLEKRDSAGVLYHSIGVNGARFEQFCQSPQLFDQLAALNADLYIVSLGTNEAQNPYINPETFLAHCDSFRKMIRKISPRATLLFTTPPASFYKGKRPNKSVQSVSKLLNGYCVKNNIPCWDLFRTTSGLQGALPMKKYGLLGHDLVHFTTAGYQLQGLLLSDALARGYNNYEKKHPWVAAKASKVHAKTPNTGKLTTVTHAKEELHKLPVSKMDSTTPPQNKQPAIQNKFPEPHKKSNIKVEYSGQ